MNKVLGVVLLWAFAVFGQQERIAIMHTVDDGDSINVMNLGYLTDRLRDIGGQVLPKNRYGIMTQQSIVDRLGSQERAEKECREATCIADLGRKINADYIAQGRIGRFAGKLTIKVELYKVSNSNLLASLTGDSDDLKGLLAVLNEKAPDIFKKMPGVSDGRVGPFVAGGISGLESGTDYVLDYEKLYLANFATEPPGAILSFNGMPAANCAKTPCSVELAEGGVRVIAALDQHETADTVVLIKQNGQFVNIRLKSSFGVLEVKPAYLENIGRNESWNFAINGKFVSSWENKLSPGKYSVKLSHKCYEDISFDAGINKDKREVFEMAGNIKPKLGGLVLSAEKDDKPVSEPVFVDGKEVGETPYSGSVPVCSDIKVGEEKVNVKLEYKQTVRHVHKVHLNRVLADARDGKKYRVAKIGSQIWMAENLNYDVNGSKCHGNNPANCERYGRLYDWKTAMNICPAGWHLPSKTEWEQLAEAVGGEKVAGKRLKARSSWGNGGNGTDDYSFSALPGGYGLSDGTFYFIGYLGNWWSTSEGSSDIVYIQTMHYEYEDAYWGNSVKSNLYNVRCLQDAHSPIALEVSQPLVDTVPVVVLPPAGTIGGLLYEPSVASGDGDEEDWEEGKDGKRKVFSWGLRFGLNASHLYAEYENSYYHGSGTYKSTPGFQLGLVFDWALTERFHIQPGIMYIQKGTEDNTFSYIEIPLLPISLKFSSLRINAGPYLGIGDRPDLGLSVGFGFDIGRFYMGMFYDHGLTESYYYEDYYSNYSSLRAYNRTLGFDFGVNL